MAALANAATTAPADSTAVASNLFAMDLYALLSAKPGNLCISPYSISSALNMTSTGAGGQTAAQMLSMLHWTEARERMPQAAWVLMNALYGEGENQKNERAPLMQIANSLFAQNGFSYRQDFLDIVSKQFAGGLQTVDFSGRPQQALKQINQWAAQQTHDRIKDALSRSDITPSTRLILVNAIYFKAEWQSKFNKLSTALQPFFIDGKEPANASLMQQRQTFNYYENDSLQVTELPYTGDFSLLVVLPRAHDGLPALEKSLTADLLSQWSTGLKPQLLQVLLPKFKNLGSFGLKAPLMKLGMTDAFDPRSADFSGISSDEKLNIDDVIHKTFIQVDEAGTEAAAITAIVAVGSAMMPSRHPEEPIVFRADHPFLYLLRHRSTGTILFIGRVSDPR